MQKDELWNEYLIDETISPRECAPQVTSPWFTKLLLDAKLWSNDISLAYTGPDTTFPSFIDHSKKFIPPKKTVNPTCEDALAALVKEPVNKKKRTKRVKCEEVVSSHANEHFQIVCWDPLANQHREPDKKKRKIPTKKVLYMSDLKPDQNRLNLPQKQLITEDFLSDDERRILESEGN
ncbi:B3 domain-containing protein, DNA-binding pseudobarrel domain protein [Tanacetum coccineum]